MSPIVSLGGVSIGGPSAGRGGVVDWELRAGITPSEHRIIVSQNRVAGIPLGVPLELVLADKTIQHVYVMSVLPGIDDKTRTLLLSDRRWLWEYPWVSLAMNIRRATGEKIIFGEEQLETAIFEDRVKYTTYSLQPIDDPNVPWNARNAIDFVFNKIGQPYRIRDPLPEIEVEGITIEGNGAQAIDQVLRYIPGVDVFIDHDGVAVLFDTRATLATGILERVKRKANETGTFAEVVDRKAIRPSMVRVLFDPDVECKFTFREGGTRSLDSTDLSNVAQSPDALLELADGSHITRGSWEIIERLFAAWGAFGFFNTEISVAVLRKYAMKSGLATFESLWGNNPALGYRDPEAMARARAISNAWRRTFMLDRTFFGRLRAVKAIRAAILSTNYGTRARAQAYCDWIRRPSLHGLARAGDPNTDVGWQVLGFAENLVDAKVAPAIVRIVDPQAGIFEVNPQIDPHGHAQSILLGRSKDGIIPDVRIGQANKLGLDQYAQWDMVELSPTFNMHVVMTVVPGTPNDTRRLWAEEVTSQEAGAGEAHGPVLETRVFSGVAAARFAWSDELQDQIVQAIRGNAVLPREQLMDPQLIRDIAVATAKRVYDAFRDEPVGITQVAMKVGKDIEPVGSLSSVRHKVVSGSAALTELRFAGARRPVDIWRYLPASARKAILFLLDAGEATGT